MQLLKCVTIYVLVIATGIFKASPSYVSTSVPGNKKNACCKTKACATAKEASRANDEPLFFYGCRIPEPVEANGEEIVWNFRVRMLFN
jgi:hypothetical protein